MAVLLLALFLLRVLQLVIERADTAAGVSNLGYDNLLRQLTRDRLCNVEGRRHEGGTLLLVAIFQSDRDFLLRHRCIFLLLNSVELVEVGRPLSQEGRLLLELPFTSDPLVFERTDLVTGSDLRTFALLTGMLVFLFDHDFVFSGEGLTVLFFYLKYN